MQGNKLSSFKKSNNSGAKRRKFGEQSYQEPETSYRILCHYRKIGGVIGKGGGIVKALREETQAKITVAESVPGSEERVILIYSPSTKIPIKYDTNNNDMQFHCAAQDALLKVHDRIVEEDIVSGTDNGDYNENVVARLLVPSNMVGCLLGKKGDVIQRLRSETGANIRVLPADQLPTCAMSSDELVQISAIPAVARRALYEVSTLLHQNPRKDKPSSGFPMPVRGQRLHPPGSPMANIPPPSDSMWLEQGSSVHGAQPMPWLGEHGNEHFRYGPVDFDGGETPMEFSMKILCSKSKIGGVIGKGGSIVRQLQQETGTSIHVDDVSAESDERVISVSSFEVLGNPRSQTIDAILLLQDKTSDHSEKGIITTRLLIPSSKVGCILGQGGQIINEMRRRTRADIRVYPKEEKPKCAGPDEELVQVSGNYGVAKDALTEIASRFRTRCLGDGKPGSEGNLPGGRPFPPGVIRGDRAGGYEPFKSGGREYPAPPRDYERDYEPLSYPASPPRDYGPRGYPAPPRDYESRGYLAPPRDYEPRGSPRDYEPRGPPRDYEPHGHPAPPRDYEPHGRPAPPRDYETRGRPSDHEPRNYPVPPREYDSHGYPPPPSATGYPGAVDMKMPKSGQGSAMGSRAGNASEIMGTRLKLQDPYAGGSDFFDEIRRNPTDNVHHGFAGQKRSQASAYHNDHGHLRGPYSDTNSYHHYPRSSYQY